MTFEDDKEYEIPSAPWLHHLLPEQQAQRESEILRGRNPDPDIERKLIAAGVWPEKKTAG